MRHESVISRIISAIRGGKVAVRENLFYDTVKGNLDFADDDLVNKRTVAGMIAAGGIVIPPTDIVAGTTDTPLVIPYADTENPGYTLVRLSDNSFDWNTNVQYDGTNFTINGGEGATAGKFADSFTFAIKP